MAFKLFSKIKEQKINKHKQIHKVGCRRISAKLKLDVKGWKVGDWMFWRWEGCVWN